MSDNGERKLTMNDIMRAAWSGGKGKVVPPDLSKGETWDGQVDKALESLRGNGRHKANRTEGGKEVTTPDSQAGNGDGALGEQLDPFTMNDLIRKGAGY